MARHLVQKVGMERPKKSAPEEQYKSEIAELSRLLARSILSKEGDALLTDPSGVDGDVMKILRGVGDGTMSQVLNELSMRLTEVEKKRTSSKRIGSRKSTLRRSSDASK